LAQDWLKDSCTLPGFHLFLINNEHSARMTTPARPARRRLDHIDAMRPVKQVGVVSTHAILYFAPVAAAVSSGAALLLLHVSREGFFFISACMLAYAYEDLSLTNLAGLRHFYWRRFLAVGVPYLCWTLIYFFFLMPTAHYSGVASALRGLAAMAETGYFQLYFLIVIMQFYLVFPLLIMLLRRTRGHHGLVLAATALAQLAILILTQTHSLPSLMQQASQQDALSYLLYLVSGCIVALHLEQVDVWVRGHARLIVTLTMVAALAAEGLYFLAQYGVTSALGSGYSALTAGDSAFLPTHIPFNAGVIACGYLAGVALVRPGRSRLTKAVVRSGADNAYGVYLSQLLVLHTLRWLGWGDLSSVIPWPLLCLLTVGIVIACCVPLTALLARTPLAAPLTGRRRVPWHDSGNRRPAEPRQQGTGVGVVTLTS
jgi:peptidoglycan/LPS O-acetylase OafA/YrhL